MLGRSSVHCQLNNGPVKKRGWEQGLVVEQSSTPYFMNKSKSAQCTCTYSLKIIYLTFFFLNIFCLKRKKEENRERCEPLAAVDR